MWPMYLSLIKGPLGEPDVVHVIRGVTVAHVYCRPVDNTTGQTVPSQWTLVRLLAITVLTPMTTWWRCRVLKTLHKLCAFMTGRRHSAAVANFDGVTVENLGGRTPLGSSFVQVGETCVQHASWHFWYTADWTSSPSLFFTSSNSSQWLSLPSAHSRTRYTDRSHWPSGRCCTWGSSVKCSLAAGCVCYPSADRSRNVLEDTGRMVRLSVHVGRNIIWFSIRLVCTVPEGKFSAKSRKSVARRLVLIVIFSPRSLRHFARSFFFVRSASLRVVPLWTIRPWSLKRPIYVLQCRSSGRLARVYVPTSSHILAPSKLPIVTATSKKPALLFSESPTLCRHWRAVISVRAWWASLLPQWSP